MKSISSLLLFLTTIVLFLNSCNSEAPSETSPSNNPGPQDKLIPSTTSSSVNPAPKSGAIPGNYPIARQGNLTAWLTSNHKIPSGEYIYSAPDAKTRHRIVGRIRASDMEVGSKHDGALVLTDDYTGPIYPLWEERKGEGQVYTGRSKGWIPVNLSHSPGNHVWVRTRSQDPIGPWSGYPIVIGQPSKPESIAGAMWFRSTANRNLGGATSPQLLKEAIKNLSFKKFVD